MFSPKDLKIPCEHYEKRLTVYSDESKARRAAIIYFHGGGLLFGSRNDLPDAHIKALCSAGYVILAFDYPLAPAAKIEFILADVCNSIEFYIENREKLLSSPLPYFLFGRSAGAYLSMMAGLRGLSVPPIGIISFYGFGFLCNLWYSSASEYYLSLPAAPAPAKPTLSQITADGNLQTHYGAYVYARQHGNWIQYFYEGREKDFLCDFSLRNYDKTNLPFPLLCTHSENDPDVPFREYSEICGKFNVVSKLSVTDSMHDFDRNTRSRSTKKLLDITLEYLESVLSAVSPPQ